MHRITWSLVLIAFCFAATFSSPAAAKKNKAQVDFNVCNKWHEPVKLKFYHAGDRTKGASLFKLKIRACSCAKESRKKGTNSLGSLPIANVKKMRFRRTEGVRGEDIVVCVDDDGKLEGYADATDTTKEAACTKARDSGHYLKAPRLASTNKTLKKNVNPASANCLENENGKCAHYEAEYFYQDGTACYGNPNGNSN